MFGACAATASRTPFVHCVRDRQRLLSLGQNKEGAYGMFESALIVNVSSPKCGEVSESRAVDNEY